MDVVALLTSVLALANTIAQINLKVSQTLQGAELATWAHNQEVLTQPIIDLIKWLTPKLPAPTTPPAP